jgi:O-antigen/teichoic acid export membrane protein
MPQATAVARTVVRNALSGAARFVITAMLAVVVTPYMLSVLGREQFGLWALGSAVVITVRLADFGLERSLVREVATLSAGGTPPSWGAIQQAVGTTSSLYLSVAALLLGIGFAGRDVLLGSVLGIPPHLRGQAGIVVLGMLAVECGRLVFSPFARTMDGLQRMDLSAAVDTMANIFSKLSVFVVLGAGWGIPGLVAKEGLAMLAAAAGAATLARRMVPDLTLNVRLFRVHVARRLLTFGGHVQAVNLAAFAIEPLSKTLLTRTVGLESVAMYDIGSRLVGYLVGMFQALVMALFPAAADLQARLGPRSVADWFERSTRYLSWIAWPTFALVIGLAPVAVEAWLGPGYTPAGWTASMLGAGWLVAMLSMPSYLLAQGSGRPSLSTAASLTTAGVGASAAVVGLLGYGYAGLVAGNAVGFAVGGVTMFVLFLRSFALPAAAIQRALLGPAPILAALVAIAATALAHMLTTPALLLLAAEAGVALLVYTLLLALAVWLLGDSQADWRLPLAKLLSARPADASSPDLSAE